MARNDRNKSENGVDSSPAGTGNLVRLGPKDSLVGKLTIAGELHIQGSVEGELDATGDVQIDPSATVRASIGGRNVTVRGQVQGNVTARRRLTLAGSGSLNGDVRVNRLSVEDGATLNGNVQMQAAPIESEEAEVVAEASVEEPVAEHAG